MSRARLLQTTLLASLGLNLFLLGVMVPGWLGHRPPSMHGEMPPGPLGPGGPMGPVGALLRQAADQLPPADAALLREQVQERPDLRVRAEGFEQQVETVRELMRAEPFDPDALAAALTDISERRQALDGQQMQSLVALLARMSPEGRRVLADFRFQHPSPKPGKTGAIPYDRERGPMRPPGPHADPGAPPPPPAEAPEPN